MPQTSGLYEPKPAERLKPHEVKIHDTAMLVALEMAKSGVHPPLDLVAQITRELVVISDTIAAEILKARK
jgi:hypothetical protein